MMMLPLPARAQTPTGTIRGRVVNAGTQEPLPVCNVVVLDTPMGSFTDTAGNYVILNVPAGTYRLSFQYLGFAPGVETDVIVRPERITYVNSELHETLIAGRSIQVTAGYFPPAEAAQPTSTTTLSAEEVRRFPGSAGDVSRILQTLPSTARVADNQNDLVVRGGSPAENGFYIDGLPVPGINHFPVQGATGGPIGFLNVDVIDDVTYSAGGFGAEYGDRLSAIVDIRFREGNREEFDGQIDLNLAGLGAGFEGPLAGGRGSWLFSARRSFLDLLIDRFEAGGVPVFGDVHAKAVLDIDARNRISVLNLYGASGQEWDAGEARKSGLNSYGTFRSRQNTTGVSWRSLRSRGDGFSTTSLSATRTASERDIFATATAAGVEHSDYAERVVQLRHAGHRELPGGGALDFGLETAREGIDHAYRFPGHLDRLGDPVAELAVDLTDGYGRAGAWLSRSFSPSDGLSLTLGLRGDYSALTGRFHFSPRLCARLKLGGNLSLTAAGGIYHQGLPYLLISQAPDNTALNDPRAVHAVLGLEWLLSPDTRLRVEAYEKRYDRCPVSPADPALFVLDEGTSLTRFGSYSELDDTGRARVRGVEALLQKKLARRFYGFVSASVFRARYRALDGIWRDRAFDNRCLFSVVGGYRPSPQWELSVRWGIAGGRPYSPYDPVASAAVGSGVIDTDRINAERLPTWHTLDLRLDRRIFFRASSLIAYVSVWNVYDRRNIEQYYWDEVNNRLRSAAQWRLLPVAGFEFEF